MTTEENQAAASVDPAEIARFSAIADEWWDPHGKFRPLHRLNPVRLAFVKQVASAHFGRDAAASDALHGLALLDIGCGGGLICEPMARLGASVTGIDPSPTNIEVARLHAADAGLAIDYRAMTAEMLACEAGEGTRSDGYDIVLALEVVEHVADLGLFVNTCASCVRPGGLVFFATLNRTLKAFALAIVGAEYLLGWLPRGTHQWSKFVRPEELREFARAAGLASVEQKGIVYDPFSDVWTLSPDMDVNYMMALERRA